MNPRRSIIPMFVPHVGCPNCCVFCNQVKISGASTPVTGEQVRRVIIDELQRVSDKNIPEIAFYGGSFTAISEHEQEELLSAAVEFVREGKLSGIRISTRPDCIDAVTLERLKRYAVTTIELGVQSLDPDVLKLSKRGHTPQDCVHASKLIKEYGFSLILQMMTGLPGTEPEKDIATANKIAELNPDGVRIYPTVVIEGTELCGMWRAGEYIEHDIEAAVDICAKLTEIFREAHIPIIRLGLNPSEELGKSVRAGAYHPALGELVYSRIFLNRERELLKKTGADKKNVVLMVNRRKLSQARGQKNYNVLILKKEFGLESLNIIGSDELSENEVVLLED